MRYLRLVALAGGFLALSTCGDPEGPIVAGPPFFTVTIDGNSWVPDAVSSLVISNGTGTASSISASRVSSQQGEEILILFPGFPAKGQFPLVDLFSNGAIAFFSVFPLQYSTNHTRPGLLSITGVSTTDSLMLGTFSFEAATTPDSTAHHVLTGQFRIRYQVAHFK